MIETRIHCLEVEGVLDEESSKHDPVQCSSFGTRGDQRARSESTSSSTRTAQPDQERRHRRSERTGGRGSHPIAYCLIMKRTIILIDPFIIQWRDSSVLLCIDSIQQSLSAMKNVVVDALLLSSLNEMAQLWIGVML